MATIDLQKVEKSAFISLNGIMYRVDFTIDEEEEKYCLVHDEDDQGEIHIDSTDEFKEIKYFKLQEF